MKKFILTIIISAFTLIGFSQTPPPPNNGTTGSGGDTPVGGGAPISGGLGILVSMGLVYAYGQYNRVGKRESRACSLVLQS